MIIGTDFCTSLKNNIVTLLNAFSDSQTAQAETEAAKKGIVFYADYDCFTVVKQDQLPFCNVWTDTEVPEQTQSGRTAYPSTTVTVNIDLITSAVASDSKTVKLAIARLDYLKNQVRFVLCSRKNVDLGFPVGIIASRTWPRFTPYKDGSGSPELPVVGGRLSFDVTYTWDVEELAGTPLDSIKVKAPLFGALYTYQH